MLRKHNKLIMLLVLVTFMFTMVGSAGAATFSDVTGTSAEASAIYKLNSLGIIDGYPDGTFGPEKTITRAEFAKIACVTAGLKSVASGMGGTASPFSDVATDYWANGWINVAAAQGFVKGDPAGTFRPEDQITQAEAVTVLLRILGYNDNLAGNWPSDYIAKAANLGVLDDVTFVADQAATRGVIAVLSAATLDENVVVYKASDNIFEDPASGAITLLEDKFDDSQKIEDVLVRAIEINAQDDYVLDTFNYETYLAKDLVIAKDVVVTGAANIFALDGAIVDYVLNDDDEVIFISVDAVKATVFGSVDEFDATDGTIEIDDVEYDLANRFFISWSKFNETIQFPAALTAPLTGAGLANPLDLRLANVGGAGTDANDTNLALAANIAKMQVFLGQTVTALGFALPVGDKVSLYFNDDNEIVYISKTSADAAYVIDEVKDDSIKTKTGYTIPDLDEDNVFISRNLVPCELSKLQKNDLVYHVQDAAGNVPRGFDSYIVAVAFPAAGTATKVTDDNIYIDGNKYPLTADNGRQGFYAEDSSEDEVLFASKSKFMGEKITAYLDGNREVSFITGATSDSTGTVAGIIDAGWDTDRGADVHWIKMVTSEGVDVDLDIEDDYWDDNSAAIIALVGAKVNLAGAGAYNDGTLVEYELNADGDIDDLKAVTTLGSVTAYAISDAVKDYDRIFAGGAWRYVDDSTVIFDYDDTPLPGDIEIASWADIEDASTITADVYYDDDAIDYIVVTSAAGIVASNIEGVFDDFYADADGDKVDFWVDGAIKAYEYGVNLVLGAIYEFNANSSDEISGAPTRLVTAPTVDANDIVTAEGVYTGTIPTDGLYTSSDSFVLGTTPATAWTLKTNSDTLIYNVDEDVIAVAEYGDIDEGDELLVLIDDGDKSHLAKIIIILTDANAAEKAAIKAGVTAL